MAGCGTLIDRVWREYGWLWESLSTEYGESMVDYGKAYRQSMERLWLAIGNTYRQSMERVWLAMEILSTEYGRDYGWLWECLSTEYGESMAGYGNAY